MSLAENESLEPDAPLSVAVVSEDEHSAGRISEILRPRFEIVSFRSVDEALQHLQRRSFDVMLLDLSLEEGYGLDPLLRARVAAQAIPVVVLTYQRDEELAIRAVRAGAQDYLAKGEVTPDLLTRTLRHAMERHRMMRELTEAQQRQHFLATHDPLTRLPNRYSFLASLRTALHDAERNHDQIAVLFFDLDGFKSINDNLGHAAGDELLTDVAGRLRRLIRKSDLVARLGGDEFVAALRTQSGVDASMLVADKIRDAIQKPYYLNGLECYVSTSIGVALYPQDGAEADFLIRCADTAMYQAKSTGKNQVRLFDPQMNESAAERFDLVNGLREAIRSGLFTLMFQPQVDIARQELLGAETLVRWQDPVRGLVSPTEFIGVAEETGLIVPLGEWVLRTACQVATGWPERLRIAVNLSERQLVEDGFAARVGVILEETQLRPERLELELTESLAASDSALEVLKRLRGMGIRTAIDDFGTGYSSLTLLKRLPVDVLKIDRSFASGAVHDSPDAVIVEATIRMARGLGLEVIAEGVETLEEMDALRALGCTVMQGYLFSKPIGKASFEAEVLGPDPAWRLPLEQPEGWLPAGEFAERIEDAPEPAGPDEAGLPALREPGAPR